MGVTAAQRRMLLIGAVPLVVLVLLGAALTVATIRGKRPIDYAASFAAGPQGVRIYSEVPTSVVGGVNDQVRVTVDGTYAAYRPKVDVHTVDGVLDVRTTCPDGHCDIELRVEVPERVAVQVKAHGASLDLAELAATVRADADQGTIWMNRMRSPQVAVDARRGSVAMQFDDPPQQVTATVSDGSLNVQVPGTTTYQIDAVAAQGSAEIGPNNDSAATHRLFLRTSYGSITVS